MRELRPFALSLNIELSVFIRTEPCAAALELQPMGPVGFVLFVLDKGIVVRAAVRPLDPVPRASEQRTRILILQRHPSGAPVDLNVDRGVPVWSGIGPPQLAVRGEVADLSGSLCPVDIGLGIAYFRGLEMPVCAGDGDKRGIVTHVELSCGC